MCKIWAGIWVSAACEKRSARTTSFFIKHSAINVRDTVFPLMGLLLFKPVSSNIWLERQRHFPLKEKQGDCIPSLENGLHKYPSNKGANMFWELFMYYERK